MAKSALQLSAIAALLLAAVQAAPNGPRPTEFPNKVVLEGERPTVTLDQGIYVGAYHALPTTTGNAAVFSGIPFASPPKRFEPPKPPPKGNAVKDALFTPNVCPQMYCA